MRKKTPKESIHSLALSFLLPVTAMLFALCSSAKAQQPTKIARVGYLSAGDPVSRAYRVEAFRQGLKDLGYTEVKNIIIEYRYSKTRLDLLPELARELVGLNLDIIFAGSRPATEAAKNATKTIPIVTSSSDPVGSGYVAGLAQPGGNITGLTNFSSELVGKRLELLKEVIPQLSHVAVLFTPGEPAFGTWANAQVAAQSLGVRLQAAEVKTRGDLEPAFAVIKRERAGALITLRSPVLVNDLTKKIIDLAAESRLPAIYDEQRFPQLGGLMSYGVNLADLDRRAAIYIDKILKGAKPADLPVEQPTKFELVINLKTAKALGLKIPAHLLMEADGVIE
jgi:putative tryptophan/tyrosine transport system substrate-binding protein